MRSSSRPDFTRYRAVSVLVREIFKRHTDLVEPLSLDEGISTLPKNQDRLADRYACACAFVSKYARN